MLHHVLVKFLISSVVLLCHLAAHCIAHHHAICPLPLICAVGNLVHCGLLCISDSLMHLHKREHASGDVFLGTQKWTLQNLTAPPPGEPEM